MQVVKNRAWVKNVAILFLAVLLVLTFFSNTIMNRSLPEVATQSVSSGPVTVRVRGTGTVTAVGAYDLKADQTRKIQAVLVRAGQEVNPGDVLFVMGEGASEELEQATENLRQLEMSYKRAAAGMPVFNYDLENKEIAEAKKAEADALAAMNQALEDIKKNNSSVASFEDALKEKQAKLNNAQSELEKAKAEASDRQEKQREIVQELSIHVAVLDYAQTVLQQYIKDNSASSGSGMNGVCFFGAPIRLGSLEGQTPEAMDQMTEGEETGENEVSLFQTNPTADPSSDTTQQPASDSSTDTSSGSEPTTTEPTTTEPTTTEPTTTEPTTTEPTTTEPTTPPAPVPALAVVQLHISESYLAGKTEEETKLYKQKTSELDALVAGCQTAEDQLSKVNAELTSVSWQLNNSKAQLQEEDPVVASQSAAVEKAQAELDALLKKLGPYADDYYKAKEAYEAAKSKRETLEIQLQQSKSSNGRSAASAAVELQDLSEQIARAKEKLEELSGGTDNQITAPVGGIIDSIAFTAGNVAPKGEILCKIQVPDLGYTLSFSCTNEQARRLRTGDTATVSNYYWGSEILATLDTIQTDPQSPQTNKLLTFTLNGDVNPGQELTVSVGSRSQNYDTIVPNSAIRSDTNGSFVLRLEAKNSPLGNRYYARRVDVTVLAQDDVNAAVSGEFEWGDFVITTSDRPVNVGDQVRMTDNG